MRDNLGLKIAISIGAVVMIFIRAIWPGLNIDVITLGLLLVAILPWFSGLIKSAEFPGGWKIEFQDVKNAGDRIVAEPAPHATIAEGFTTYVPESHPSFLTVAPQDPNLALVGLRIEIEKRVRALAEKRGIAPGRPLSALIRDLQSEGSLLAHLQVGSRTWYCRQQAAHGAASRAGGSWAMQYGPAVLGSLTQVGRLKPVGPNNSMSRPGSPASGYVR
jgi:hypothetical protein